MLPLQPPLAPPPHSWFRRRLIAPFVDWLRTGLSPGLLALTVALGVVFGFWRDHRCKRDGGPAPAPERGGHAAGGPFNECFPAAAAAYSAAARRGLADGREPLGSSSFAPEPAPPHPSGRLGGCRSSALARAAGSPAAVAAGGHSGGNHALLRAARRVSADAGPASNRRPASGLSSGRPYLWPRSTTGRGLVAHRSRALSGEARAFGRALRVSPPARL